MTVYDIAERLPSIDVLRERCKALAMLDAVVGGDYYSYDREWGEDEAASMRRQRRGVRHRLHRRRRIRPGYLPRVVDVQLHRRSAVAGPPRRNA
ncbi:hypothetical protein [Micromonospora noduli]|uniref:hypothetical protein n=1 Tax=Micromonospora noduli TaxID=709876 RepID=UPI001FCA0922|nr:hypothetical protein [Micromonospora noduli]